MVIFHCYVSSPEGNFPSIFPAGQEDVEAQIQAEHDARLAAEEVLLIGFRWGKPHFKQKIFGV